MDIVCHGVAAPHVWRDYVDYLESNNQQLAAVNFRDKNMVVGIMVMKRLPM